MRALKTMLQFTIVSAMFCDNDVDNEFLKLVFEAGAVGVEQRVLEQRVLEQRMLEQRAL